MNQPAVLSCTWPDVVARRLAVGLSTTEMYAECLDLDLHECLDVENRCAPVDPDQVDDLMALERFVSGETARLVAAAEDVPGDVDLVALAGQDEFAAVFPDAVTGRGVCFPLVCQHVAVGRAAAELTRRGRRVRVWRGGRTADVLVRRIACGLTKRRAAPLFRLREDKYGRWERGLSHPWPVGLVAELQALDDYITATAAALPVVSDGPSEVVLMLNDPETITETYPGATRRDAVSYPRRVHRVAAGRRAGVVELSSVRPVRIGLDDE